MTPDAARTYQPASIGDLFQRCFELARELYPEKETARLIAAMALLRLKRSMVQQDRRLKHVAKVRNKVLFSEERLLQQLLFETSTPWEIQHENTGKPFPVRVEHLTARWFKFAIAASSHNSFWASVSKCRILYHYTTAQTRSVYEFLLQNPDRGKDDDQYRRVKKRFLRQMKGRFEGWVRPVTGAHGEGHVACLAQPGPIALRAHQWQQLFASWGTHPAIISPSFDPGRDTVPDLIFRGGHVDEEAAVEARRIHTLFHPDFFLRVTRILQFDDPLHLIAIPEFVMKENDENNDPADSSSLPLVLDERDHNWLNNLMDGEERARMCLRPSKLAVAIDGKETDPVDAAGAGTLSFHIGEDDRLLEVFGIEGSSKVCMGSLLIVRDEDGTPQPGQFVIEGRHWNLAMMIHGQNGTLAYGASAALLESIKGNLERVFHGIAGSNSPDVAPAFRLGALEGLRRSAGGVCPCCGGLLLESTASSVRHGWRTWKCDRCPYVSAHQT